MFSGVFCYCRKATALVFVFFFSSRRRHTRFDCDWSSDVCSSDLPWVKARDGRETGDIVYFTYANRGKKSITVNIAVPEGQALIRALAASFDVLIENYKYGDLARYGLGYDALRKTNPGLIDCSLPGFGQSGPWRERAGYDFMIQGMGGMMSVTGEPDGAPGGGAQRAGVPIADIITGMYSSIAICAALAHRAQSGFGQHLDLALLDSQIALLAYQNTNYFATGVPPQRIGNLHPNIVPYQPFRSSDGQVILACGNDNLYRKFCAAAGCPALAEDPRFASNGKRVENRAELTRLLEQVFIRRSTREWVELLEAAGALVVFRFRERPRIGEPAHELLVPARRKRRAVGDASRGRIGFFNHLVVGHDAVHQALLAGFARPPDAPLEENLERGCAADDVHHSLQLVVGLHQPEVLDRNAEARRLVADPQVALRRDQQSAADAGSLDECDDRVTAGGEGMHRRCNAPPVFLGLPRIAAPGGEGGNVGTGRESLFARAAHHDTAQRFIVFEFFCQ